MDCNPPGSSVHEISQARIVDWIAIPFSSGSSPPRGQASISCVCCIGRRILYHCATWTTREALWFISVCGSFAHVWSINGSVRVPVNGLLPTHCLLNSSWLLARQDGTGLSCTILASAWNQPFLQGALVFAVGLETKIWVPGLLTAAEGVLSSWPLQLTDLRS